jgi:hypothetical protein
VVRRFMVFLRRLGFLRYCRFSAALWCFFAAFWAGFLWCSCRLSAQPALWCSSPPALSAQLPVSRPLCDVSYGERWYGWLLQRVVLAASAAKAADDRPIAAATTRANTFFILKSSNWFS